MTTPTAVPVMSAGRRQAGERTLIEASAALLSTVAAFAVALGPVRAVDARLYLPLLGAAILVVAGAVVLLLRRQRRCRRTGPPRLTHHGIEPDGAAGHTIGWTVVAAISIARHPLLGRQLRVTFRDGTGLVLRRPRGALWLPDPAFDQDTSTARRYGARHGVPTTAAPHRRGPLLATAAAAAGITILIAGWAGVRVADRDIVWPGQPVAATIPHACQLLQAVSLDRVWPKRTRTRTDTGDLTHVPGTATTTSTCTWWASPNHTAPYQRLQVRLVRYHGTRWTGPVAAAIDHHHTTRTGQALSDRPAAQPRTLRLANADDAFASRQPGGVQLTIRRANVRIEITVDSANDATSERLARHLAAAILPHVDLR